MMTYNQGVEVKVGQRWRYGSHFIGEIESFTDPDHVKMRVLQTFDTYYYPVGKLCSHTLDDSQYTLLVGQDRP